MPFLVFIPQKVFAAEEVASGSCGAEGDNITWVLDDRIDEIIEEKQMDIKKTQRFLSIISRIEIVFVTLMIVLSPLKQIPYDAFTTKTINTVTIVTFGMLFLTVFIESLHDDYEQSANLLLVKVKNMR